MQDDTMLGGYRVLDLTEGGCLIGGQIFGDLGADVIKIEPPRGSPSRTMGPFYKDIPDPEKSLFWFAYNRNKRSITLDIEKADGKEVFKRLVKTADIVLESFYPDYLDALGLGYADLCRVKSDIILTSVTPYGSSGPKSHYKASDLTIWAASVILFITGDPDRAPTWVSWPSAGLHGGIEGVFASLFALWHREATGEGQHVDAAIQPYLLQHATGSYYYWECIPFNFPRMGPAIKYVLTVSPMLHRCKDGYVFLPIGGGATAGMADSTARFVQWMDEEGAAPQWLVKRDWVFEHDTSKMTQEEVDRVINPFVEFLRTKTKSEVSEEAAKRGIMACAVSDTADICHDRHLQARDFWVEIEHPELGQSITYNGPFIKLSEAPMKTFRRAPLIGEHNEEIYEKELGLSREELIRLCEAGVI